MSIVLETTTTLEVIVEDFTLTVAYSGDTNPNVTFNATITVKDPDVNPLEGATVTVDSIEYTTDANGQVSVDLIRGDYTAEASLTGYSANTANFTILDQDVTPDIILTAIGGFDESFDESFDI